MAALLLLVMHADVLGPELPEDSKHEPWQNTTNFQVDFAKAARLATELADFLMEHCQDYASTMLSVEDEMEQQVRAAREMKAQLGSMEQEQWTIRRFTSDW